MSNFHKRINALTQDQRKYFTSLLNEKRKKGAIFSKGVNVNFAEKKEYYELTPFQKRIFQLYKLNQDSAYNIPLILEFKVDLDLSLIEESINKILLQNESLRTRFIELNDEVYQRINPFEHTKLICEYSDKEDVINIIDEKRDNFDLINNDPIKFSLIKTASGNLYLIIKIHHIISDGTSIEILMDDFIRLYENREYEPTKYQFKDYLIWQKYKRTPTLKAKQKAYWKNIFKAQSERLNLPYDDREVDLKNDEGDFVDTVISKEYVSKLKEIAFENKLTLNNILLAAYYLLLNKLTHQKDIIVGVPTSNRPHANFERIVGLFLNTIYLRSEVNDASCFIEFAKYVKSRLVDALDYSDFAFEELMESEYTSLIEQGGLPIKTVFNSQNNTLVSAGGNSESYFKFIRYKKKSSTFDLSIYPKVFKDKIVIECSYKKSQFYHTTIKYIIEQYNVLIKQLSLNPQLKIGEIDLFSQKQLLQTSKYQLGQLIVEQEINDSFLSQMQESFVTAADKIALVDEDCHFSYDYLNQASDNVARELPSNDLDKEYCAAVLLEDEVETIISFLAILKTGNAFVPIDIDYPDSRIEYILNTINPEQVITTSALCSKVERISSVLNAKIELLTIDKLLIRSNSSGLRNSSFDRAGKLCVKLFTSGSTGQPKVVEHSYSEFSKYIMQLNDSLGIKNTDRYAKLSKSSHAVGILNVFCTLSKGATLFNMNLKNNSADMLPNWMEREETTILHTTPSIFKLYNRFLKDQKNSHIRMVILGGEHVSKECFEYFKFNFPDDSVFVNFYGLTEKMVGTLNILTKNDEVQGDRVSIGCPVMKDETLILRNDNTHANVLEPGELCFLRTRAAKTSKEDLGSGIGSIDNNTLIRTGDISKYLPDGLISLLGRKDYQYKIRGYRVNLEEIESVINKHLEVLNNVVIYIEKDGLLLSFYTTIREKLVDQNELKRYVEKLLPQYMVPNKFVHLIELPKLSNGKINRKALVERYSGINEEKTNIQPSTETERIVYSIWGEILEVDNFGTQDSFYYLGGHSLKEMLLLNKLNSEFNLNLSLIKIREKDTVYKLSKYIDSLIDQDSRILEALNVIQRED